MTPKDHTATQGASELGDLLDRYGRRYHEAMVAKGKDGTEQRANDARKAIVEYAIAQRQPAPADPQAPFDTEAWLREWADYWRKRALDYEDAYKNLREWAQENGLDTCTYGGKK